MSKNLFIAATPLHVYTAAEIVYQEFRDSDNWFLLTSSAALEVCSIVDALRDVCKGVRILDYSWCSPEGTTVIPKVFLRSLLKARFFPNAHNLLFELKDETFEKIFVFSPNALTAYVRYMHGESKFLYADEGSGSYTGAIFNRAFSFDGDISRENRSWKSRAARAVNQHVFAGKLSLNSNDLYLHAPNLLEYSFPGNAHTIKPNAEFCNIIRTSFPEVDPNLSYEKFDCIFLGQPFAEIADENAVMEALGPLLNSDLNWVYRKHPRESSVDSRFPVEVNPGSWELRCMREISDKSVLISFCSTAMSVPKMLYGMEPTLIFLNRLLGNAAGDMLKNKERFISSTCASYENQRKIIIPGSLDEFSCALGEIGA